MSQVTLGLRAPDPAKGTRPFGIPFCCRAGIESLRFFPKQRLCPVGEGCESYGFASRFATATAKSKILTRHLMPDKVVKAELCFTRKEGQDSSRYHNGAESGRSQRGSNCVQIHICKKPPVSRRGLCVLRYSRRPRRRPVSSGRASGSETSVPRPNTRPTASLPSVGQG